MRKGLSGGNLCLAPPHVRGEDNAKTGQARPERETPPRAWGRLFPFFPFGPYDRNTPTCVGKTAADTVSFRHHEKHPHVRGEDTGCGSGSGFPRETPPRAWGRPCGVSSDSISTRNTPTCVGKTSKGLGMDWRGKKHPHVRGEDSPKMKMQAIKGETPPRAWGRH